MGGVFREDRVVSKVDAVHTPVQDTALHLETTCSHSCYWWELEVQSMACLPWSLWLAAPGWIGQGMTTSSDVRFSPMRLTNVDSEQLLVRVVWDSDVCSLQSNPGHSCTGVLGRQPGKGCIRDLCGPGPHRSPPITFYGLQCMLQ